VFFMIPILFCARKRNTTEVTPPNVHLSAEGVSRSFNNVRPETHLTTSA
jgi:hypothetical protein